jgi:hypothetical protein
MKAIYNIFTEAGRKAAVAEYLATKERVNSYVVTYRRYFYKDGDCDDYTPEYFKEFTDEQVALVRELLARAKEEGEDLWGYLEDEKVAEKYAFLQQNVDGCGQWYLVPESVDLDTVYHRYGFKLAIFYKGFENQPTISDVRLAFSDEEYIALLDWKMNNPRSGFNFMRISNPELYQRLTNYFDNCFTSGDHPPFSTPTYAVEMTEVEMDVKRILAKYGEQK